jgi:hypothetical protein
MKQSGRCRSHANLTLKAKISRGAELRYAAGSCQADRRLESCSWQSRRAGVRERALDAVNYLLVLYHTDSSYMAVTEEPSSLFLARPNHLKHGGGGVIRS